MRPNKTIQRFLGSVLAAAALGMPAPVHAGYQVGHIKYVWIHETAVDVEMDGTPQGKPACAAEIYWRFDPSTPGGGRLLSAILTAHSTGREVLMSGTDTCPWLAREWIDYIQLR